LPRHAWLKEVDQAPEKSSIRRQKDKYLREIGIAHGDIRGLFGEPEGRQLAPSTPEELAAEADRKHRREDVTEALRMYRLLRPDAPPFFEEDAALSMESSMNRILQEQAPEQSEDLQKAVATQRPRLSDPFAAHLPMVNQKAFLAALESVVASLADDIETMCEIIGLDRSDFPNLDDPLRFKKLLDILFGAFPLRRDPSRVDEFMADSWPTLRLLLPQPVAQLPTDTVADWLRGHLRRVKLNRERNEPTILLHQSERFRDEEYYSFAEDFPYDDDPMPASLADERNLDFPLEKAEEYMLSLLEWLAESPVAAVYAEAAGSVGSASEPRPSSRAEVAPANAAAAQFQDFVWDLEKIGLRNWLRMDIAELQRYLPKGPIPRNETSEDDLDVAKLMLRCAARGRTSLLDFEAVDPYALLHGFPARRVDEELASLPPYPHMDDAELGRIVDVHRERQREAISTERPSTHEWEKDGASLSEVFQRELDFYRKGGPVEWYLDEGAKEPGYYKWRWRQPPNTMWDEKRKVYVPQQKGVDPNLDLTEMRQCLCELSRMGGMAKEGRVYYFRAIVVVGNGKGIYGIGIGFGRTPKMARSDAALKGLQNLDYIDMDPGRMLCFPCRGTEFKMEVRITPRPIGRGIVANKRFLPLLYVLGLDNVKVKFRYRKWFSRIKALKRALDMIVSRRTLANATGKRYALLVAPGDHWVHWPDRWFENIREQYDAKAKHAKLVRRHMLHFKNRGNTVASNLEVKPGWRKENWARWSNPLERWLQYRREQRPRNYDPNRAGGSNDSAIPPARGHKLAQASSSSSEVATPQEV